jgi:hypothetical protein
VLTGWGLTARDVQARVLAARIANEKAEQLRAAQAAAAAAASANAASAQKGHQNGTITQPGLPSSSPTVSGITTAGVPDLRPSISIGGQKVMTPGGGGSDTGLGIAKIFGEPNRLGGPKAAKTDGDPPLKGTDASTTSHMQFLRAVHASACKTFGTTLGPEANDAHRNHFHFDLAERKTSNFCE